MRGQHTKTRSCQYIPRTRAGSKPVFQVNARSARRSSGKATTSSISLTASTSFAPPMNAEAKPHVNLKLPRRMRRYCPGINPLTKTSPACRLSRAQHDWPDLPVWLTQFYQCSTVTKAKITTSPSPLRPGYLAWMNWRFAALSKVELMSDPPKAPIPATETEITVSMIAGRLYRWIYVPGEWRPFVPQPGNLLRVWTPPRDEPPKAK